MLPKERHLFKQQVCVCLPLKYSSVVWGKGVKTMPRRSRGELFMIQASCAEIVVSLPPKVSLINTSEEQEEEHRHQIPKSPVTINSSSFQIPFWGSWSQSRSTALSHFSVSALFSDNVSGRQVHLRLGTSVWAALHRTRVICDTAGLYKPGFNGN